MSHYCTSTMTFLHKDWYDKITDAMIRALPKHGGNLQSIYAHINTFFDAHLINRINRVCVTLNCQNPWPAVLCPAWDAAGYSEEHAAKFVGNLFCRVAISRPEVWLSAPYPIFKNRPNPRTWTPRHYFVGPDDWPGAPRVVRS